MSETIRELISEEDVAAKVKEIGAQITKDYEGKAVHLICVLKGGVFFTCELAKRIEVPVSLDFMSVSSYGDDTKSSGVVKIIKDLDESIEGKDVLIVEDIIDSGRTLSYLIEVLKQRNPASIRLCTLLDKPERPVGHDGLVHEVLHHDLPAGGTQAGLYGRNVSALRPAHQGRTARGRRAAHGI